MHDLHSTVTVHCPVVCAYPKPLPEVFPLEVVVSVGMKSKVDEEPSQHICIDVCTNAVLHTTCEVLVVNDDGYGKKNNNNVHSSEQNQYMTIV